MLDAITFILRGVLAAVLVAGVPVLYYLARDLMRD
jgi:hypothetical protein